MTARKALIGLVLLTLALVVLTFAKRALPRPKPEPVSPLDVTVGASGNSSTSSSGSATTTAPNELLFGANTVWTVTQGPGLNFTRRIITPDGDIVQLGFVKFKLEVGK